MFDFIHPCLDEEVIAIGGRYVFTQEVRLPYVRREVLYHVGYAAVDSSCCGLGGIAFAAVAGFVVEWRSVRTPDGREISRVEPIEQEGLQAELRRLIKTREHVLQVNFL
jgi:hypothetical protein